MTIPGMREEAVVLRFVVVILPLALSTVIVLNYIRADAGAHDAFWSRCLAQQVVYIHRHEKVHENTEVVKFKLLRAALLRANWDGNLGSEI
jgi:hypothetical protein